MSRNDPIYTRQLYRNEKEFEPKARYVLCANNVEEKINNPTVVALATRIAELEAWIAELDAQNAIKTTPNALKQ